MRLILFLGFLVLGLSSKAQWEVVPSGTDSALYCISRNEQNYFVGGVTNTLLKSLIEDLNFIDVHEEYDLVQEYSPVDDGITKIGILNDSTLLFQKGPAGYEVYDSNLIYSFRGGSGVSIDSNLTIIVEDDVDIYIDTTVIGYVDGDGYNEGDAIAMIGTISWVVRSIDGNVSYDIGTALNNITFINTSHTRNARYLGCIDFDGALFFSTDSAETFTKYQSPALPYDFDENAVLNGFSSAGFYFNEDLIGFYAPRWQNTSSMYKVDMTTGVFTSMEISPEYNWNRITMQGSEFVIAVGDSGMVASSFDQGYSWTVSNIGTELNLYGVDINDEGDIIIVGDSGLILTNSIPLIDMIEVNAEGDVNEIDTDFGTLQLSGTVFPESAPQDVSWTMLNVSGTATIDQNGLVTAQGNGLVIAIAEPLQPSGFNGFGSSDGLAQPQGVFFIHISGQPMDEQYIFEADTTICGEDVFDVNLDGLGNEYLWSDGSSETSLTIESGGTYWVVVSDGGFHRIDSIEVSTAGYPVFEFGEDISACKGEEVIIEEPIFFGDNEWSTGSTDDFITVTETGEYSLSKTWNNCTWADQMTVTFLGPDDFDLGEDISICEGESEMLVAPVEGEYEWSSGVNDSSIEINQEGWYSLTITVDGCSASDSLFLTVKPLPEVELGADTTVCDTASLILSALNQGASYDWSNGAESAQIEVTKDGVYSVQVILNGCTSSDEINVEFVNCTLSLLSEEELSQFKIYPNPAKEITRIEIPERLVSGNFSLLNIEGKLFKQGVITSTQFDISLSDLEKGIYLIQIEKERNRISKEIIKN